MVFYFDGRRAAQVQYLSTQDPIPVLYQELSAYFCDNNFWCVLYNAVANPVGSGRQEDDQEDDDDDEDDDSEDEEDTYSQHWMDWRRMQFNYDNERYVSLASVPGEHDELAMGA